MPVQTQISGKPLMVFRGTGPYHRAVGFELKAERNQQIHTIF